jgi:hypothetical protein
MHSYYTATQPQADNDGFTIEICRTTVGPITKSVVQLAPWSPVIRQANSRWASEENKQ